LYPTVAELAGLKASPHIQGKSLVNVLNRPQEEVRSYAFSVSKKGNTFSFLVRSHKWAFIQYGEDGSKGMELFDMEYDEKQFNNLALNPRYKHIVKEFRQLLSDKLKNIRTNDLSINYKTTDR